MLKGIFTLGNLALVLVQLLNSVYERLDEERKGEVRDRLREAENLKNDLFVIDRAEVAARLVRERLSTGADGVSNPHPNVRPH